MSEEEGVRGVRRVSRMEEGGVEEGGWKERKRGERRESRMNEGGEEGVWSVHSQRVKIHINRFTISLTKPTMYVL